MSKFAIYLEQLIRRSDEPIARIAKQAGIERTSIHKALKDERLLPYPALKQLIQYFQLTLPEIREINLYYDMLIHGEETYYVQTEICQLLSDLAQIQFSPIRYPAQLSSEITFSPRLIQGKYDVEHTVMSVLRREIEQPNANFRFYLPQNYYLSDMLNLFWKDGLSFTVEQIVSFLPENNQKPHDQQNIHTIRQLLPTALLSNGQYHAYFCYFSQDEPTEAFQPLPYFITTPNYLLCINPNFTTAYLHTDQALLHFYQKHFDSLKNTCQPLISYINDWEPILRSYMENNDESGYFTIMPQPCLGRYYSRALIKKYIRPDFPYRLELIEMGDQRFSTLRELKENYFTIFSENGLRQFAQNGEIIDLPSEIILPLDLADRLDVLKQFRTDLSSGNVQGCIADTDHLSIPPYLTFTCDPQKGLHIYTVNGFIGGAYGCNLHLETANIGRIFCDFIRTLPNSKFVCPLEQTLSVLDNIICELEEKIRKEEVS